MYNTNRLASITRPRHIAMYLASPLARKSLPELGERFDTLVRHAVRKIGGEPQKNIEPNQRLHVLEPILEA